MAYRNTRTSRRPKARKATSRRASNGGNVWSRQEIAFLRKYYRKFETAWVARQLGRTVYSVRYKASDLSIKKASPKVWKGHTGDNTPTRATKSHTRKPARRTSRTRWAAPKKRNTRKARSTRKTTRRASQARRKVTRKAAPKRTARSRRR